MIRVVNILMALIKAAAEAVAILTFIVAVLFILVGSFLWFLTPWQQRKIRERYRRRRAEEGEQHADLRPREL